MTPARSTAQLTGAFTYYGTRCRIDGSWEHDSDTGGCSACRRYSSSLRALLKPEFRNEEKPQKKLALSHWRTGEQHD